MAMTVTVQWRCDRCGAKVSGAKEERPPDWQAVDVLWQDGTTPRQQRLDLCAACQRRLGNLGEAFRSLLAADGLKQHLDALAQVSEEEEEESE
jgi:hypothetical protein